MDQYLTRQMDILPPSKLGLEIAIVGAGAIGSQTAMCLAKMGFTLISVYDFDVVDEENMNCQWYGPSDIGSSKVTAIIDNVEALTNVIIGGYEQRVDSENRIKGTPDVIICAVDSMKVRSELWDMYKDSAIKWWIDPRMGAEEGLLYGVNLREETSKIRYEKTLYTDDEAVQEACTAKATMYCAMILSGQVAKKVKDIAVEDPVNHTLMMNIKKDDYLSFGDTNVQ